jgi:hypothetical protein
MRLDRLGQRKSLGELDLHPAIVDGLEKVLGDRGHATRLSRTYRFEEINEGFRLLTAGSVARGVTVFE